MVTSLFEVDPILQESQWLVSRSRAPRLRSMREFAEAEVVLPAGGPAEGLRFSVDRQPFAKLWFEAIESGRWERFALTAPSQQGKTLIGSLIPLLWHLFEVGERVVFGLPDLDMVSDKLREDILPVIERTRYRDLLPSDGGGSRGGKSKSITFRNGATLRFMTFGGRDKSRAGYTARVLICTEVDGAAAGGMSVEADKIEQLEARTRSHGGGRSVTYLECTTSIEQGRIWQEYTKGTQSRIALPCPHCSAWVTPEREHVVGWEDADTEIDARDNTQFHCPGCGGGWTEKQRLKANTRAKLLHRGQAIDEAGKVSGALPKTLTLGFRWSAVNNFFRTAGDVGMDLWHAARDPNEDNSERKLAQFVFAVPYIPTTLDELPLSFESLTNRTAAIPRSRFPDDGTHFAIGVDLGKRLGHFVTLAGRAESRLHVPDYGIFEIHSDDLGIEKATLVALREFRDKLIAAGWTGKDGSQRMPNRVLIDAGYPETRAQVIAFCRESNEKLGIREWRRAVYLPLQGFGETVYGHRSYTKPRSTGNVVKLIGDGWHVIWSQSDWSHLVEANVDRWKTWAHQRMAVPVDSAGAVTWFAAPAREHTKFVKHLLSEVSHKHFVQGKGEITTWERPGHGQNHYLDGLGYACLGLNSAGFVVIENDEAEEPEQRPPEKPNRLTTPDGRPYLLTDR
jgi:phage terminase large subunit GpA-like protein